MFIELTNYETGQKELVNTQWIEEIRDGTDYRIIYFALYLNDENEQDYLRVEEEYYDIKHLLGIKQCKQAHWELIDNDIDTFVYQCSNCKDTIALPFGMIKEFKGCPYCLSRMDEVSK